MESVTFVCNPHILGGSLHRSARCKISIKMRLYEALVVMCLVIGEGKAFPFSMLDALIQRDRVVG